MLNLIANENMKIYRRLRTWILIGLIVLMTAVVTLLIHSSGKDKPNGDDQNWRAQLQQEVAADQQQLSSKGIPDTLKEPIERNLAVNQYRLAHNLPPDAENIWAYVLTMANAIQVVTIFTVIVAADIVAGEFTGGTIKLLLIRPASRSKILLSKYIATLLFSVFLLAVLFAMAFIMGGTLTGFQEISTPYLYAAKDLTVHQDSMLLHALGTYGLKCIELIMVVTLAFMISTVFRSSLLALGISLLTMFVGGGIVIFIRKYAWVKYYLFANTDLTQYLEGHPLLDGMTMRFSIAVLAVYFLVFNGLSWLLFNKRDVAA